MTDRSADGSRRELTFVDTHVHLDDPAFDPDRTAVIDRARSAGVAVMVNVGYAPSRWDSTIALATSRPDVVFTLGLHPGHADECSEDVMMDLERRLSRCGPRAVGEIGLDYSRPTPDRELQRQAFALQLELASTMRLPVVIHQRDAAADCAAMLSHAEPQQVVVLHSFDGSAELLTIGLDRGWLFGVGGLMSRRSSIGLRQALQQIPLRHIVLETDSPYLVPVGTGERRNHPGLVPRIAETLANHLRVTVAEVATSTTANAARVFSLEIDGDD